MLFADSIYHFWKRRYKPFFGSRYFLEWSQPTDLGCWRLTLSEAKFDTETSSPQPAGSRPAKVAKRIGCVLKKDVLLRLDGAVLLVEFLVRKSWSIFMSPFHERELLQPVHQPIKWHLNVLPACEPIRLRCMLPTVATCKSKVGWFREFCEQVWSWNPFRWGGRRW